MNQQIKSFYLTYNGHVATPNFPNGDGVASKVIELCDAFGALGFDMEVHADLTMVNEVTKDE